MNRFFELRKNKNLTQNEVSSLTGIDQGELSKIERGIRCPTIKFLIAISKFYKVSVDYLLGLTDVKKPYKKSTENVLIKY